jgi:hypothetical protein
MGRSRNVKAGEWGRMSVHNLKQAAVDVQAHIPDRLRGAALCCDEAQLHVTAAERGSYGRH